MGSLGRGQEQDTRPRPPIHHLKDTENNIMALVTREAQALESRLEWELASRCSNYQQLLILKKNQGNENGIQSAASCQGMTPSERLMWYRTGGRQMMDEDSERLRNCGTWKQYHLMTRGRAEPRDPDQEITKSERLHWYRYGGGKQMVEDRAQLCRDSGNWQQYKLARDSRQHASSLTDSMTRHWSDFRSKEEVSDYISSIREESLKEREEIRAHVRSQVMSRASVAKECYEAHCQPWAEDQVE